MSITTSNTITCFATPPPKNFTSPIVLRNRTRRAKGETPSRGRSQNEAQIIEHLAQVRIIAKKIRRQLRGHVELDDLIGYGTLGLITAVERFDASRGTLLKTYAEHRIRGAILDGLRRMNWLSRSACRRKAQMQKNSCANDGNAAAVTRIMMGNPADPDTAPGQASAPAHGLDWANVDLPNAVPQCDELRPTLLEIVCGGWLLENLEQISEHNGWRKAASAGSVAENPEAAYERNELARQINRSVARLPPRERALVEMRYQREMSMNEISRILGVHPSRVSQLHTQAMKRLKLCAAALTPDHSVSPHHSTDDGAPTAAVEGFQSTS